MTSPISVRMYTAFERFTLITETAVFTAEVSAAVFVVHETPAKFRGQAVKTIGKTTDCPLPLSARACSARPLADRLTIKKKQRDFSCWAAQVTAVTASPSGGALGEPTHFAASMDESVIVGYYTLKKCRSPALRCLQISKKGKIQWQEMMESTAP